MPARKKIVEAVKKVSLKKNVDKVVVPKIKKTKTVKEVKEPAVKKPKKLKGYEAVREVKGPGVLHIVDASDWIHRSFHAMPVWFKSNGKSSNALMGFSNQLILLLSILRKGEDQVALAFDAGKTWRNSWNTAYKKGRAKNAALQSQLQPCRDSAISMLGNKHCIFKVGLEADDVIAELVMNSKSNVVIHTRDQDIFQLASSDKVKVCVPAPKSEKLIMTKERIEETFGIPVSQLANYWAITGQAADGIAGIRGTGPKTAKQLIMEYGSNVDDIWKEENAEKIIEICGKAKGAEVLKPESKISFHSGLEVMRLPCSRSRIEDVSLDFTTQDYTYNGVDVEKANNFLYEWNLKSVRRNLEKVI